MKPLWNELKRPGVCFVTNLMKRMWLLYGTPPILDVASSHELSQAVILNCELILQVIVNNAEIVISSFVIQIQDSHFHYTITHALSIV